MSKEGIAVDPDKVKAILGAPPLANAKALSRFLGQIRWHSQMLWYLADFVTPLHTAVHRIPFQWTELEDRPYHALKVMLSQAPVVQPLDWSKEFHVLVDTSDIAIDNVLMQLTQPWWYWLVYYASRKLSQTEQNYSTTEREALGMVYSVMKFRHYLLGSFSFALLGLQVTLNRQASTVDATITRVRIRHLPQTGSATYSSRFLEPVRIQGGRQWSLGRVSGCTTF